MTGLPPLPARFFNQFDDNFSGIDLLSLYLSPPSQFWATRGIDFEEWGDSLSEEFHDALVPSGSTLERFAPSWSELLTRAVEEPGLICEAYTRFHGYSLGNRFAALIQCELRGLEPGPLNSFGGWRKLGYAVKEGEKALTLCMPLKGTLHREKAASEIEAALPPGCPPDVEEIEYIRAFTWKPNWFVLGQTVPLDENTPALPIPTPLGWDQTKALETLKVTQVRFQLLDGNALGFARQREIGVSPLSPFPFKTLFHEMAHVVLGHTTDNFRGEGNTGLDLSDGDVLERKLIEVEAESVALMLLATLDLPGQEYCRGYIQHWLSGDEIPEKSAQRIFGAADRILSAGVGEVRPRVPTAEEVGLVEQTVSPTAPSPTPIQAFSVPISPNPQEIVAQQSLPPPETPILSGAFITQPHTLTNVTSERSNLPMTALFVPVEGETTPTPLGDNDEAITALKNISPAKKALGCETDAWALYGHLQQVHSELHPTDLDTSRSYANGLRYLKRVCPEAAVEVKRLVQSASKQLKTAFEHLEVVLDGSGGWETANDSSDFDPFEGMAAGEVRYLPKGSASTSQSTSPIETTELSTGKNTSSASQPLDGAVVATPPPSALSPSRQAAARRTVGRSLRSELQFEKERFLKAAKAHELAVGRRSEKVMLAAISSYLGISVQTRRDLSSHQWAHCASAIETEDLRWEKV